jgi:hypothetical protein
MRGPVKRSTSRNRKEPQTGTPAPNASAFLFVGKISGKSVVLALSASVVLTYRLNKEDHMTEYLMFVCTDTEPDTDTTELPDVEEWVAEGTRRGLRKQGDPLVEPSRGKTIRVRNGETLITDGPFAETKEWIAGYDLLEAKDLDEAVEYASRHPMARNGRIEVREVMVWED